MSRRPANQEMIDGFRDGYDLSLPEPGTNRSASYRHGFMCGRIDKGKVKSEWNADQLRSMAEVAMLSDEAVAT